MASALSVVVPLLVFWVHARMYHAWVVDDAGITFSFARSVAQGYGLVPQPGAPPVEGYSNFLWLLAYVPFFLLGWFDPAVTPKFLSFLAIIGCYLSLRRLFRRCGDETGAVTFVALSLLSLNTSFVAWCVSGLENPLYVFLLAALAWQSLEALASDRPLLWRSVGLGALAAAVGMTRPEGVLFFFTYPIAVLVGRFYRERVPGRAAGLSLAAYAVALTLLFGGFLAFRVAYFHDWLPNTYYAKGGPGRRPPNGKRWAEPIPYRFLDLAGSVVSERLWRGEMKVDAITPPNLLDSPTERRSLAFVSALAAATLWLIAAGRYRREHMLLGVFLATSIAVYLALPSDWMKEYRFGTPFFLFIYAYAGQLAADAIRGMRAGPEARLGVGIALALAAILFTHAVYTPRSRAFAAAPTVDFDGVREWLADRFNYYAEVLEIEDGSLLVPDLGATLFYSKLRIYDLGMLCDKVIARTMGRDQAAFYDYIFEVAKPTFIHTHGTWSYQADLDGDPRFRRDYVPIMERLEWWQAPGISHRVHSGDYVRRDAIAGREHLLDEIRPWFGGGGGPRGRRPRRGRGRRAGRAGGSARTSGGLSELGAPQGNAAR